MIKPEIGETAKSNNQIKIKRPADGANLVQQRILPQSEHHHVGAVPSAKRGEKVLKGVRKVGVKRWFEEEEEEKRRCR